MVKRVEKLTPAKVIEIRNSPLGPLELSERYGVCTGHIHDVRSGKRWAHIAPDETVGDRIHLRGERSPRAKLTDAQVATMLQELADGCSQAEAARRYGISTSSVHRIVMGEAWQHIPRPAGMEASR
jgi:DNA-binding NarL/FixJ family response regulator